MALDSICVKALTNELSARIVGMKIDKATMPERDLLILSLRGKGDSLKLLMSASVGASRVHVTEEKFENPQTPPMFCMFLRKHLQGSVIRGFVQPEGERMVEMQISGYDELGEISEKKFILEMIGRASNFVLVSSDGRIMDCLRRVDFEMSEKRQILPGLIYHYPPKQEKPLFHTCENRAQIFQLADEEKRADKWLTDAFAGLSPLICREICVRSTGQTAPIIAQMSQEEKQRFLAVLDSVAESVRENEFTPYMIVEGENPRDFSFMSISQYGEIAQSLEINTFSELIEGFYSKRDRQERMKNRSRELFRQVKNRCDRQARKLENQRNELKSCENREELKHFGDLITANIYRMKKGDEVLECEDYYDENLPIVKIKLDILKTPQQNAAEYFRQYTKAKNAENFLVDLIEKGKKELHYLESVLDEIERAEGEAELLDIKKELTEQRYIREQKASKKQKHKETKPRMFVSDTGLEIFVGRNNAQNDKLTTQDARRTDIWLHVQKIHGSHVIISVNGQEPDDVSLVQAASLAAFYSQARGGGKVPVDYTQVRFVKKPSGSLPGKVIYTDYKTIMAEADEKLAKRLEKK